MAHRSDRAVEPPHHESGRSSSRAASLRPPAPRHDSHSSSGGSRDRRSERPRAPVSEEDFGIPDAELPMQVTETVVAAAIRLNVRMRELEEVMDLYDDFSRTCQHPDVFESLCMYFAHELLRSYHAVRGAWVELDDLRVHRYGTEGPLGMELEAGKLIDVGEDWKREQRKRHKEAVAGTDREKMTAEEAKTENLQQTRDFSRLVRRGIQDWDSKSRRGDIEVLRAKLLQDLEAASEEASKLPRNPS